MGEVFEDILDNTERVGVKEDGESQVFFHALQNLGLYEIAEKLGAFSRQELLRCDSED